MGATVGGPYDSSSQMPAGCPGEQTGIAVDSCHLLMTRIYGDPVGGSTSADQPSHQAHHTDSGPGTDPRSAPGPP